MQALASDGIYRSQFETGTSNGSLTAHQGGIRWHWESRIFGSAYDGAPPFDRPKYGALNYTRCPFGASPRFGSAHLRLKPEILFRATFCYPDSVFEPSNFGVFSRMPLVSIAAGHEGDLLDNYIEAQVHGPLRLACDVEALVLDPCYAGTEIEKLARTLPCPLEWHPGFRLDVGTLREYPTYRGPEYVALGEALAREGYLTAAVIGEATLTDRYSLQDLKKVWHYVARFGECAAGAG